MYRITLLLIASLVACGGAVEPAPPAPPVEDDDAAHVFCDPGFPDNCPAWGTLDAPDGGHE